MLWLALFAGCRQPAAEQRPLLEEPLACAPGCARAERARAAIERAVGWLGPIVADPARPLNADVLIATLPIRSHFRSKPLERLISAAWPRVDLPGDPRRRLFDPNARLPDSPAANFVATPGASLHPNQVLVEVLYCPEHGLRSSTVDWLCSDFRDEGGPESGHAAWYQAMAVDSDCVTRESTCLDALATELRQAALTEPEPTTTEQIDRLAEQVLFSLLAGTAPHGLEPAIDRLMAQQQPEGSFRAPEGTPEKKPSGRAAFHATLVSAWALDVWLQQPSSSERAPGEPGAPAPPPPAPAAPVP